MTTTLQKLNQHKILFLNIIFTITSIFIPLAFGFKFIWYILWILIPILANSYVAINCILYMSLYMRVIPSVQLFSILIFISIGIILFKKIFNLYKNKQLINHLKIFLFYLILITFSLFYSILLYNTVEIYYIYYLNMINLLFLFYLIKNELDYKIIIYYCYAIIASCIVSILAYCTGLYYLPFHGGMRFHAFMQLCNTVGINCIMCISALYVLSINKLITKKRTYTLIAILTLLGIMTFSKSFLISAILVGTIICVREFIASSNKKIFAKYSVLILVALSPILIYYGLTMWNRLFGQIKTASLIESITTNRVDKWLIYLKPYIKSGWKIIFGLGFGFDFNTIYSSHSFYVGYLSKMGIIGLLALIIFIVKILYAYKPDLKLYYLPIMIIALICIVEDLSYNTFNFIPFAMATIPFHISK